VQQVYLSCLLTIIIIIIIIIIITRHAQLKPQCCSVIKHVKSRLTHHCCRLASEPSLVSRHLGGGEGQVLSGPNLQV
jgi:hypothetical protein